MGTKKPGRVAFYAGSGILALAILASLLFGLLVGGPLIAGGLGLIVVGLGAKGRAAAGKTCAACPRKIIFEHEAEFCEVCDLPVHAACAASHRATAHKLESGRPFR